MEQKYTALMIFPDGTYSKHMYLDKSLLFDDTDPILNMSAKMLAGSQTLGMFLIFGCGMHASLEYENGLLSQTN